MQIRIHNGSRLCYLDLMYMDVDVQPRDSTFIVTLKFTNFKEEKPNWLDRIFGYGYRKFCDCVTYNHKMKVITQIQFEISGHDYTEIGKRSDEITTMIRKATGRIKNRGVPTKNVIDAIEKNISKIKTYVWSRVR